MPHCPIAGDASVKQNFCLVRVEFAVLVLLLAFPLERYDDETDEDVDHKERDDDDIDDVEQRHLEPVVINSSHTLSVRINTRVHQTNMYILI